MEVVDSAVFSFDIRNPMMHAKYKTMQEYMMMEETAPRLVVTTSRTPYLTTHPTIGKNINDFSNVSLLMGMIAMMMLTYNNYNYYIFKKNTNDKMTFNIKQLRVKTT
jgi:hypothetical protein